MWMISKIFTYSFRSEMSTSQDKPKRISSFEEGELSKFGTEFWGRAVCFLPNILAAVIFQEPWKVQAVKHQIIPQVTKVWVWKGDVFRKARPHKHSDARVQTHRGRSVGPIVAFAWSPNLWKYRVKKWIQFWTIWGPDIGRTKPTLMSTWSINLGLVVGKIK